MDFENDQDDYGYLRQKYRDSAHQIIPKGEKMKVVEMMECKNCFIEWRPLRGTGRNSKYCTYCKTRSEREARAKIMAIRGINYYKEAERNENRR